MEKPSPSPVDIFVGRKIMAFRTASGMSQRQLGDAIGVSFQQVQKYEIGSNRISASRLFAAAQAVGRSVSDFFPDQNDADFTAQLDMSSLMPLRPMWLELNTAQRRLLMDMATALKGFGPK